MVARSLGLIVLVVAIIIFSLLYIVRIYENYHRKFYDKNPRAATELNEKAAARRLREEERLCRTEVRSDRIADFLSGINIFLRIIVSAAVFFYSYIYCISKYGFLFGLGLGWLPSGILSLIIFILWPVFLIVLIPLIILGIIKL